MKNIKIGPRVEWLIIGILAACLGISVLYNASYSYQRTYYLAIFDLYKFYPVPINQYQFDDIDRTAGDFWEFAKQDVKVSMPEKK